MEFLEKLLLYYSLTENEYLDFTKEGDENLLPFFDDDLNFKASCEIINRLIAQKEKILIYGDYDCDGIMATSIIYKTIADNEFTPGFYIPFREKDGYGINKERVDFFYSLGYRSFILVDNGITANEVIDYMNSLGITTIIIDHHERKEELPKTPYIIHPTLLENNKNNISAGALAFYFSKVFLKRTDKYLLSLGALSLLSDMMPLIGDNRNLVKLGFKYLKEENYKQFELLNGKKISSYDELSMNVIPKINAVGRIIKDLSLFSVVKYFCLDDDSKFYERAKWLNMVNIERKLMSKEAIENIEYNDFLENSTVLLCDCEEGISGIIANQLLYKNNNPTVVFSSKIGENGTIKGSLRSRDGFNVIKALTELSDIIEVSGGHALAGGLQIKSNNFEIFKKRFDELAKKYKFVETINDAIEISVGDINKFNFDIYNKFQPFGMNVKKPVFKIKGISTKNLRFTKDKKHIIVKTSLDASIIFFNYPKDLLDHNNIDLLGYFDLNEFKNKKTYQFIAFTFE